MTLTAGAQSDRPGYVNPEDRVVDMDNPTFVPMVKVGKVLMDGDSVQYVRMNNVFVYPPLQFKSAAERMAYNRLVYNVKKVLPIAKECNEIIIETYQYLQTLPNKRARDAHMKLVEKSIKEEYTPRMKKLTYQQESCSSSSSTASATARLTSLSSRSWDLSGPASTKPLPGFSAPA